MLKKRLDYLSKKVNLGVWIIIILLIMVIGSIIIISHINNRFANLVTFLGSLIGGLITLISVSLTNRYYNQQKLQENRNDKIEAVESKIKILKYFKKETIINKNKAKNARNRDFRKYEMFETLVFETSKKEIIEIFIECEQKLDYIQKLYSHISKHNSVDILVWDLEKPRIAEWINKIEHSINKTLDMYETKLNELKFEDSRN
ncbi:hypothetical protein [Clostridium saccharobutylicum]|uniref:Uncharacterized protein n=1 Tax=Clostridium saccharobutylicum TaxID=169679 RepID=A0A1S8NK28_CLOSA|nr:hypothetical protein [Clostridium saccharobutylicum]OOM16742.1 hypothetical protein CLOSAC_10360 [Clostridium saccharobutylicum]